MQTEHATTTDAAIIDACEGWVAQWTADQSACDAGAPPRSAASRAAERASRASIIATRATTPAGLRAKARVLTCLDGDDPALALSLAADLI